MKGSTTIAVVQEMSLEEAGCTISVVKDTPFTFARHDPTVLWVGRCRHVVEITHNLCKEYLETGVSDLGAKGRAEEV